MILRLMKDVENLFCEHTFKMGRINFVLLRNGTYWNFPFTVGSDIIVVTQALLDKGPRKIMKILTHEMVHLDQRRDPGKYERYYRKLGFQKAHVELGVLQHYILQNPDGERYEWIYRIGNKTYIPLALLLDCKMHCVLVELHQNPAMAYTVAGVRTIHKVDSVSRYYHRFGTKRQLYHPNEIVAHLIADYLVDKREYYTIDYNDIKEILNG